MNVLYSVRNMDGDLEYEANCTKDVSGFLVDDWDLHCDLTKGEDRNDRKKMMTYIFDNFTIEWIEEE